MLFSWKAVQALGLESASVSVSLRPLLGGFAGCKMGLLDIIAGSFEVVSGLRILEDKHSFHKQCSVNSSYHFGHGYATFLPSFPPKSVPPQ